MARPGEDDIRRAVKAWVQDHWDPDLTIREWWSLLADSGWAAPTWPEEWFGKGLSTADANLVRDTLSECGVPSGPSGLGVMLAGPTIIAHGNDEQKAKLLRPIISGEVAWCQLFSEPGAGSDLAGLQTRAVRDGDEWVVNGQKVWTSGGQYADVGMLIARTNADVPKHQGITYFAIDMNQPGIEVRPLREMTGRAMFNEVFISDARVHQDDMIGGEGNGWRAALTTLANERVGLGGGGGGAGLPGGAKAGMLDRRAGDLGDATGTRTGTGQAFAARGFGLMRRLAEQQGVNGTAVIRQRLAELFSLEQISRYTMLRAKAAAKSGRGPGPESSTGKLQISRITRLSRDLGLSILGPGGTLMGQDAPSGGVIQELALFSPAPSIYGGTDEIQKNIIGERVLGLPKEPGTDKEVPFKELRVN
jgi:alkylation response protein AidB-like acyl-CoA dehydrogenase